jgi:hypothetical protein
VDSSENMCLFKEKILTLQANEKDTIDMAISVWRRVYAVCSG